MPLIRRRPLLRAAAVGGGAYMVGKHAARAEDERQAQAYYEGQESAMAAPPPAAPAPAAPAPAAGPAGGVSSDDVARLQELGKLRDQGILTDEEFARQKALILG
jgi:Short C-terminal domain